MRRTRSLAAALGTSLAITVASAPALAIEGQDALSEAPPSAAVIENQFEGFGEAFNSGFDVVVLRPLATMKVAMGLVVAMPIASFFDFLALPAAQEPKYFSESWERYVTEPAWYAFERPIGEDLGGR